MEHLSGDAVEQKKGEAEGEDHFLLRRRNLRMKNSSSLWV